MFDGMFEDDNGGASSNRFVFVVGSLLVIGVWAWLSIAKGEFISIPLKDLGILGLVISSKFGGKWLEVIENIKNAGGSVNANT